MPILFFTEPPDGNEVPMPKTEWLRELILREGEEYWTAGSGEALLECTHDGRKSELGIRFHPSAGFGLEYRDEDTGRWFALGSEDFENTLSVYVGGDPLVLPRAFFVPREAAWAAVEGFCRNGERAATVRWVPRRQVNWHFGMPDECPGPWGLRPG